MFIMNLDIGLEENTLHFRAQGHGAKGQNDYEFSLEFREAVKPEVQHRSTQRQVDIKLHKQTEVWWDRLTLQEKKPLFLAPDFDRWMDESDAEMELKKKEEEKLSSISVESRVRKDHSFYDTFHTTADMMYFCQMMAVLEVVNPLLGLVRTGFIPALIQVTGRNVILFVIFGCVEEMQNKAVVFFVFYFWSCIEIFRYPFYMLGCIGVEWKLLTWLRYTLWMPLYPLGTISEAVAVVQSLAVFDETRMFALPLPSFLGESLSFSYSLRVYLILMFLGLFTNFRHLYKQRRRRYRSRKRKQL
ncbi:hypothetical protein WMY93_012561 [Mugilogobius chulae]|uniref:Very-long-chain (3R)-3-hydroxyacyl-CoA dehydratase n=1 Tax=Mugilogobius chulae TaxID=88201 RepID=A0AAW0NWX6_9GOBI